MSIPAELQARPQWIVWRYEKRDGKTTKVPYVARPPQNRGADGTRKRWRASTTDPSTWRTHLEAVQISKGDGWDGIGFVFSADDPFVGVDLDHGLSEADCGAVLCALDSYAERSVSGTGFHVFVRASLNGHPRNRKGPIEIYESGRYFVVTGDHIFGTPTTIEERQAALEEVLAEFPPAPVIEDGTRVPPAPVDIDDHELLARIGLATNATDFARLWEGVWEGRYDSPSEADLALCNHLAFWTNRDADRIDRLFRASGLYREKWERDDYREDRIGLAIEGCTETYQPSASFGGTHLGTHHVSQGAQGGVPTTASLRPYVVEDAVTGTHPPRFEFATAEEFAAVTEESAEVLLGDDETGAAIAAGGTGITYGDGGAGKTTLELDRALHLVTGTTWLGLPVPRKLKILIVENDGPRGPFRKKIKQKLEAWGGPDPDGRLHVLKEPWGEVNIGREDHRQALAAYIREHEIDMLLAGPIVSLGMVGGGTPDEVAAFEAHVGALRALLDRPLVVWLIHHENTSGRISGAWGRVPDTQLHVTSTGNGKTRVFWDKARWSPVLHKSTWRLKWAVGESFELDETAEATEEQIAELILTAARAHPGGSWNTLEADVTGKGETKRAVRDRLIADGELVNASKRKREFELWAADDPAAPATEEKIT